MLSNALVHLVLCILIACSDEGPKQKRSFTMPADMFDEENGPSACKTATKPQSVILTRLGFRVKVWCPNSCSAGSSPQTG